MSQQSLASKTITKRNVAQSSVIFSVIVAVITLGVIGTVAYIDITENNNTAALEKSIPELIAAQKIRLEEKHRQTELLSQAEDLVVAMDERVEDLKQLDEKVKKANEQLNFIAASHKTEQKVVVNTPVVSSKPVLNTIKTVQHQVQQSNQINYSNQYQQTINPVFKQNHATKMSTVHQINAGGEGYLEFSWLFKARGSMSIEQRMQLEHQLKNQTNWNTKTL